MEIVDLIKARRNIKMFKSEPVETEQIIRYLQVARFAPNHRMTEPWEIWFVGPETRTKLNHKTNFGGAPVVLAVLSERGKSQLERDENLIATACLIENFLLCAYESGLGVGWSSLAASAPQNREILGVPEHYDVLGLLPVGYPSVLPEPKERTDITKKIKQLP